MINSLGILVHLAVLVPLVSLFGTAFALAQLTATLVAMGFNYSVNNLVTYHDRQLTGANFYIGFIVFAVLCSLGVIGNVGIASVIHRQYADMVYLAPAMAGALITVVWNYVATQAFVWGRTKFPGFALRRRSVGARA
jgi:dolichol-phosphate mannosyltransferase